MSGMTNTHFEVRDQMLHDRAPLATTTDYEDAMRAVAALQEDFWAQLDANGEGGRCTRLRLDVLECSPGDSAVLRASSVASG